MTVNGSTTTYGFNALDQLTSAGAVQYHYDGRGNLHDITNGSQVTTYAFDATDHLTNVALPDSTSIAYVYDADGHRIKQIVGSAITNYLWDEASTYGDVVLETDGSGATLVNYVLGGSPDITPLVLTSSSGLTRLWLSIHLTGLNPIVQQWWLLIAEATRRCQFELLPQVDRIRTVPAGRYVRHGGQNMG
jgi:YD repeat-containing protein